MYTEKNNEEITMLFQKPPTVEPIYRAGIHNSKHQRTRKPKSRPRGIKHGNRKKR